jgi:aspyridone synthetase trans-acting enoyl reductase
LGAAEAFDYRSVTCGTDIRVFTKDSMEYAFDCITDIESMKICYTAIGSKGGKYVALDPFPIRGHTRRCVKPSWIITSSMINKPINWQRPLQGQTKPKDRKFAEEWYNIAQGLLDKGAIVPHPHEERTGGLEAVLDGVDSVRKGEISGTKLVYRIAIESES